MAAGPTADPAPHRRYRVRPRHGDTHHARVLLEPTSHAAAIAYVEHLPDAMPEGDGIGVVVLDLETGHEQSFWVHIDAGESGEA